METEDFLLQMERENGKYKCSSQKDSTNSFLILYLGICLMGIWQVCIYVLNWKKVHQKLHFHIQFCSYFHVGSLRNVFTWFLQFINQSHARSEKIYDFQMIRSLRTQLTPHVNSDYPVYISNQRCYSHAGEDHKVTGFLMG